MHITATRFRTSTVTFRWYVCSTRNPMKLPHCGLHLALATFRFEAAQDVFGSVMLSQSGQSAAGIMAVHGHSVTILRLMRANITARWSRLLPAGDNNPHPQYERM